MMDASSTFSEQLRSEIEQIVLSSDLDLRNYASQVEEQLSDLESGLIDKYITVGPEVAKLHRQITTCDAILERMEAILSNFHQDLGTISSEIQDLQMKSMAMNNRLQNRQSVRGELSQFLSEMAVPEQLIRNIISVPVTEQDFLEHLHELDHKISFAREQSMIDYRSFEDIHGLLKKLKIKAVSKIREYVLQKIYSMRKPLTNYQVPQNQMLKYRFYNEFLLAHDRETATEVRAEYVNTMSKVYYSYFKAYYEKLIKLQMDTSAEKDVLLGKRIDDQASSGSVMSVAGSKLIGATGSNVLLSASASGGGGNRLGLFGIGGRSTRVLTFNTLQESIILPHVASKADVKYPIEVLFRSLFYAFLDVTCREYFFLSDFFLLSPGTAHSFPNQKPTGQSRFQSGVALANLFEQIMGRAITWVRKQLETYLLPSAAHDALGLLICLQLIHAMLRLAHERNVPVLDKFWMDLTEGLWVRVTDRLDAHISSLSLSQVDVSNFSNSIRSLITTGSSSLTGSNSGVGGGSLPPKVYSLIRPHVVSRRYAELAASLHSIGHSYPGTPLMTDAGNSSGGVVLGHGRRQQNETSESKLDIVTSGSYERQSSESSSHDVQVSPLQKQHPHPASDSTAVPALDARILSRLGQLQSGFEAAMTRLSDSFTRRRLSLVFLINNYDLVISVLVERGAADAEEVSRFREIASSHTTNFIDEALSPYFGSLISFVRDVEQRSVGGQTAGGASPEQQQEHGAVGARNEEARVTRIIKGFNIDWKNSIEKIHGEIMMEFANFTLGTQVFQALLAQFVQHYHRFQRVMTLSPYKTMPVRNQLVNIHHIMNEMKMFNMSF